MKLKTGLIAAIVILGCVGEETVQGQTEPSSHASRKLALDDIFPTNRVVDVQITVSEKDWDTLRFQSRNLISALQAKRKFEPVDSPYTYVAASVTIDGVVFPKVGIRKKGFLGSQSSTRPSLKVKLDHVDKLGGIEGLTNLTLNNNLQDTSLVSQFMGYALFNAAGSPAPRCAYARVTVNGENLGVYSHVESMRRPLIKRAFDNALGSLYEGTVVDFLEGWEGSFERKFGKDKLGRRRIKKLIEALRGDDGNANPDDSILASNAWGRGRVPTADGKDEAWTAIDFDDSAWKRGRNGAGFETEEGYESLISTQFDFKAELHARSASLHLRFPFDIEDLDQVNSRGDLVLRMKYDDGFVAYLNGHEVASRNAPKDLRWDSKATSGHDDRAAARFETFIISAHADKLRPGRNVLAIHGLNIDKDSTDMLIVAELRTTDYDHEQAIGELVDLDAFYDFWALEGLLGFWDGYSGNRNNFFIYVDAKSGKLSFLPWGADCLFEKIPRIEFDSSAPISVKTVGLVAHELYQLESGRRRYREALMGLLERHWDEKALLAETARIEAMVKPHLVASQVENLGKLDEVREFIRSRRTDLTAEVSGGMPVWTSLPEPPIVIEIGSDAESVESTLWSAARRGKVDELEGHLARGVEVNAQSEEGSTALSLAALAGRAEAVEFLISRGADVNAQGRDGSTALHGASFLGRLEVVKLLVQHRADVNQRNNDGETALDGSASEWSGELQGLVEFIAAISKVQVDTAKVRTGRSEVAALLRKHGAKPGAELSQPIASNIWSAAKSGDLDALRRHLAEGADPDAPDNKGVTPLVWAAMTGHAPLVAHLVDKGAKVNRRNGEGDTALHSAAFFGRLDVVKLMIEKKAEVNARNKKGETALDTVAPEWTDGVNWIIQFVAKLVKIEANADEIKAARPRIAELLRNAGGKRGEELR